MSSPSAGRVSICRFRRRAIHGTRSIIPAVRRPARAPACAPGCSRWHLAPTPAARCAIPASACGIVGLKPTYGLVSRRGVFPLSFTLDHVGPLTRTVADNALLLDAIAGHDPADPGSTATGRAAFRPHAGPRRARPAHRFRAALPRTGQAGASRGHRGDRGRRAHAAGRRCGGAHRHAAVAERVRRGEPGDPVQRGLVDPCALAALRGPATMAGSRASGCCRARS